MEKYLTPEGLDKFKKELDYLENIKRKEISERLRHTSSFGDLKENAAYHEAKESQSFLEGRVLKLKEIISTAKLVEKKHIKEVQIGSTVLLDINKQKEEFQIVDPAEADVFNKKISHQSPLGKIILGKKKGDKVIVKTPEGKVEYKILGIK